MLMKKKTNLLHAERWFISILNLLGIYNFKSFFLWSLIIWLGCGWLVGWLVSLFLAAVQVQGSTSQGAVAHHHENPTDYRLSNFGHRKRRKERNNKILKALPWERKKARKKDEKKKQVSQWGGRFLFVSFLFFLSQSLSGQSVETKGKSFNLLCQFQSRLKKYVKQLHVERERKRKHLQFLLQQTRSQRYKLF